MTAILPWWKERLEARCPVSPLFLIDGYYKARNHDTWPIRIARSQLYNDYLAWYNSYAQRTYDSPYYKAYPEKIPKYASETVFFSTMAPWIYVLGKDKMVRNYFVKTRVQYEGRWVDTKVRRYFIRLGTYEEHATAFQLETGWLPGKP